MYKMVQYCLQIDNNRCRLEPCSNGGTCSNIWPDSYNCTCAAGFTGTTCQTSNTWHILLYI